WCSTRPRTGCMRTRPCWCSSSASRSASVSGARAPATHLRVGILGASGYGGAGLIERLLRHGGVKITAVGSRQYQGQSIAACWPHLAGVLPELRFAGDEEVIAACDVLFCATPHGATAG